MKRSYFIAAIVAAAAGTALHFLYEVSPNLISALLSPVNESVWEHLKLLYWPTLAAALVLSAHAPCRIRLWSGFLTALLAMPLFLLGLYYGLRLLGVSGTAVVLACMAAAKKRTPAKAHRPSSDACHPLWGEPDPFYLCGTAAADLYPTGEKGITAKRTHRLPVRSFFSIQFAIFSAGMVSTLLLVEK